MNGRIDEIKNIFKSLKEQVSDKDYYFDLNFFSTKKTSISIDKVNVSVDKGSNSGIKIRVFDNEKFLEYGQSNIDENILKDKLNELMLQADNNQNEISSPIVLKYDDIEIEKDFAVVKDDSSKSVDLSLENKVDLLKKIKLRILDIDKDIVNVRIALIEQQEENVFASKTKLLSQSIPTIIFVIMALVKSDSGDVRTVYKSFVSNEFDVLDKAEKYFEKFRLDVFDMKKAEKLKGGKYKVLLSPKLAGLLAHESFGHGLEADTMLKDRALASKWIGKRIGGDNVNIVDYPQIAGKYGEFFFDHEGTLASKTYLVKEGIVNNAMSDNYSRTRLRLDSFSANSRFESFDHKNYVRMSNTYFEAGDKSMDDLISQIDEGIFISSSTGGMEDPKGWGVQLQGCFGQHIKNGKLIDKFYDGFALTGFLPNIIGSISGISKEFVIDGAGHCGKGHKEWVRVSEGGPYLLIDEVILG